MYCRQCGHKVEDTANFAQNAVPKLLMMLARKNRYLLMCKKMMHQRLRSSRPG